MEDNKLGFAGVPKKQECIEIQMSLKNIKSKIYKFKAKPT